MDTPLTFTCPDCRHPRAYGEPDYVAGPHHTLLWQCRRCGAVYSFTQGIEGQREIDPAAVVARIEQNLFGDRR